jgi:hypothetical protein
MAEKWNKEWKITREKLYLFCPAATHPPSLRPSLIFQSLSDKKEVFSRMTQAMTGHEYIGEYYRQFHIDNDTQATQINASRQDNILLRNVQNTTNIDESSRKYQTICCYRSY